MPQSASRRRSARRYRLHNDWGLTKAEARRFVERFPVPHKSRRALYQEVQSVITARMSETDPDVLLQRMTLNPPPAWPAVKIEPVEEAPRSMPHFPEPPIPPVAALLKGRVDRVREIQESRAAEKQRPRTAKKRTPPTTPTAETAATETTTSSAAAAPPSSTVASLVATFEMGVVTTAARVDKPVHRESVKHRLPEPGPATQRAWEDARLAKEAKLARQALHEWQRQDREIAEMKLARDQQVFAELNPHS